MRWCDARAVDVTNSGNGDGTDGSANVLRDLVSSFPRPVKELKGFQKITLRPGETKPSRAHLAGIACVFDIQ